jgi:hypothetical protein
VNSIDALREGKLFDASNATLNAYANTNTSVTFRTSWEIAAAVPIAIPIPLPTKPRPAPIWRAAFGRRAPLRMFSPRGVLFAIPEARGSSPVVSLPPAASSDFGKGAGRLCSAPGLV